MNKKKLILFLLIIVCLVGCVRNKREVYNVQEQLLKEYITITCTGYNNGQNTDDGMSTQIWCYE